MILDPELAKQLEEARAFQAEATRGGSRQRGRPSARGRGGAGRGRGGLPSTPPRSPSVRGGRGGGGHRGSLLQHATSRAAAQPVHVTQEQSGLPFTPSLTPQNSNPRPFAIPIVAPPSANSGLTPSVSPYGIETSMFAPQAAPEDTAPTSGPKTSHAPATRASSSLEQSRHTVGAMPPQWQPTLHRGRGGRGRGGGHRMSRLATQEEDDEVWAFFNDDQPVSVGDVSRPQSEPSTADKKTKKEIEAKKEPAKVVMASSTASTAIALASLAPTFAKALSHPASGKSGPKNGVHLPHGNANTTADHKATLEKEAKIQTEPTAEKAKAKDEAKMTPHDKASSSVGVHGCKIDVNRKTQAAQKEDVKPKEEPKFKIKGGDEVDVKVSDESAPSNSKTTDAQTLKHAAPLCERAPPLNAPTGPKNAGKPGVNYRGGGRGEREQQLLREREETEKQQRLLHEHQETEKQRQLLREREEREQQQQQLLREIEEEEAALAEKAKQIAIKRAKLMKDKDAKQSALSALTENAPVTVNEGNLHNQISASQNAGDTFPTTASNSMDDLIDLDFMPATMKYVPHSPHISLLAFSNGHSSFGNGLQEAEEEEEL
ncbi:hypothetical protein SMACR_06498 [Sordaria macrospora]|uniref:WGS project CABT00000000 data, contig 2.13 n=2 Tax=Sordaria macrospora TaxID=5147 RepID=F7VYG5_SORMK|nr:uncharacterized protein SMAC_06498 [Sordaria macrospora k-hell]KAA8629302.1 hypothetical protein SMACR_06498 [Sordaria macrospora]WPJ63000.1 hypothetical protein SMAC4_06498 [Sordaria macrospora]CCC10559.1 unnamed protein product [Sordaria macrospora k-hell]